MVTNKRWAKAQAYEKIHWQRTADKIITGAVTQLDWYEWKARQFEKKIANYYPFPQKKNNAVVEIGSGPIGIVSSLNWGKRYAIDPLEDFFKANTVLVQLRNPAVTYTKGVGENLPFQNSQASIVILDNVIDHVNSPNKILSEIHRILKSKGLLFFTVNLHTGWGKLIRNILELFQVDKGHPFTFTYSEIKNILYHNGFTVQWEEQENYHQVKKNNLQSKNIKNKIKAYLGISERLYTGIFQKG